MLVICYGIAKSGSTLAYELVRGVLMSAGHDQTRFRHAALKPRGRGNHMASVERADLASLIDALGGRILAAKTHLCFADADFAWMEEMQRARKLQVVASYRDPRDMCLSLVDHGERSRKQGRNAFRRVRDLSAAAEVIGRGIHKFAKWSSLEGTLRLAFETAAFAPDDAIAAIETSLGVTGDPEQAKLHAFEDSFTQQNKRRKTRYDTELDAAENAQMLNVFGDFIRRVCEGRDEEWFGEVRRRLSAGGGVPA